MVLRRARGFTLIEAMVVVAIVGIVSAMGVAGYQAVAARAAPQTAAHQLYSVLAQARARASERGTDVWFIVYTDLKKSPTALYGGAYFLYEDRDGNFETAGSITYATFDPPNLYYPTDDDMLLEKAWLEDYQRQNVKFGLETGLNYGNPFTALNPPASSCTFCSGTPERGAVVFTGEGPARFLDSDGDPVAGSAVGLGLKAPEINLGYLFAVSSATAQVASFK